MMKRFVLIVCGSFVGAFLAFMFFMIAAMIMSFALMGSMALGSSKAVSVGKHSILKLDLGTNLIERDGSQTIDMMSMLQGGGMPQSLGLNTLLSAIDNAAHNDKVDGIYIECNGLAASPATLMTIRRALKSFKDSGKWIIAYGNEGINQTDYYLASVADSIYLNPVGAVDVHGLASVTPYMKKLLDKVGVEMQVLRVGTFKSAVEPYMLDQMSDANRLQQQHYLGTIWHEMRDSMAADRKMSPTAFNALADSVMLAMRPNQLLDNHIIDKVCYRHEVEDLMRSRTDVKQKDDLRFVSPQDLASSLEDAVSGDHIAVVYAVGEIDGSSGMMSGDDGIDSEKLSKAIRKLITDDHVKGMVLRVNSPGGSAFGSEQIWKAVVDFKASGKPVAVSMGDYAASGGYYISCAADRIFAERTTITGSIGIFGMIPCATELVENKLGIHMESVKTNSNADLGGGALLGIPSQPLTPVQRAAIQNMINDGYELFTQRCADGRHVTQDSIKTIAEGRVWDGITAQKIGLVDEFGGLDDAVAWVANKAGMGDNSKTQNYPVLDDQWTSLLEGYMMSRYQARMQREMGVLYDWHQQLQAIVNRDHVLCLMPMAEIR